MPFTTKTPRHITLSSLPVIVVHTSDLVHQCHSIMSKWQVHPNPTRHDGLTAYEREKRAAAPYRRQDQAQEATLSRGKTEFDVLKENHRSVMPPLSSTRNQRKFLLSTSFIRDDEDPSTVSYEERLARAYESKLFKEYALVCPHQANSISEETRLIHPMTIPSTDRPEALQNAADRPSMAYGGRSPRLHWRNNVRISTLSLPQPFAGAVIGNGRTRNRHASSSSV